MVVRLPDHKIIVISVLLTHIVVLKSDHSVAWKDLSLFSNACYSRSLVIFKILVQILWLVVTSRVAFALSNRIHRFILFDSIGVETVIPVVTLMMGVKIESFEYRRLYFLVIFEHFHWLLLAYIQLLSNLSCSTRLRAFLFWNSVYGFCMFKKHWCHCISVLTT